MRHIVELTQEGHGRHSYQRLDIAVPFVTCKRCVHLLAVSVSYCKYYCQSSVVLASFYCLGHVKNVYDDDCNNFGTSAVVRHEELVNKGHVFSS